MKLYKYTFWNVRNLFTYFVVIIHGKVGKLVLKYFVLGLGTFSSWKEERASALLLFINITFPLTIVKWKHEHYSLRFPPFLARRRQELE